MIKLSDGQCGVCAHFGESGSDQNKIVQLRINGATPEDAVEMVEPCGHPDNAARNLKVSPLAGCSGFVPAKTA